MSLSWKSFLVWFILPRLFNFLSVSGMGVTLDPCLKQIHCQGDRICRSARTLEICKSTSIYCACTPINEEKARCRSTSECDRGETCFHAEIWQESPACISNAQIPSIAKPQRCRRSNECLPNRTCALVTLNDGYCAASFKAVVNGSREQNQDDEPIAIKHNSDSVHSTPKEVWNKSDSPKFSEEASLNDFVSPVATVFGNNATKPGDEALTNSNVKEDTCIAMKALRHLPQSSLLYDKHFFSKVLCDPYGSCATGGHMVLFRSNVMMMKSYCMRTTCEERVMVVNSVRYKRKFLIESSSPGLTFTAFAARYETLFEETILAAAHFFGL